MSSLAFSASPIDFQKNEELAKKINSNAQNKLSMEFLKKMASDERETSEQTNSSSVIQNIHNNLEKDIQVISSKAAGNKCPVCWKIRENVCERAGHCHLV